MAKNETKKSTAVSRQQDQFRNFVRGVNDGREWGLTCDVFEAQEFVNSVGWNIPYSNKSPWVNFPFPGLQKTLRAKGHAYSIGFIRGVQDAIKAEHSALVFHRHQVGVEDGRRWASEHSSNDQYARINEFPQLYITRQIFVDSGPIQSWTPAHWLVEYLLADAYPVDEDGDRLEDCKEFRDFWQPFVSEPMDEVMSNLKLYGFRAGHKLQDRNYIAGFVDGALGLSDQLRQRLTERRPTPLSANGRKHAGC